MTTVMMMNGDDDHHDDDKGENIILDSRNTKLGFSEMCIGTIIVASPASPMLPNGA